MRPLRRLALPALLWLGGLAAAGAALQRPAPLLVNLGAGDRPFARGFRPGWERDGLNQSGATMFHWTLDGARLELPVRVLSGDPVLRLRYARFVEPGTPITLLAGGRVVDRWDQPPRGWRIREAALGPLRGPVSLQFRSPLAPDGLGVALDWIELRGAGGLLPGAALAPGLVAWLLGLPLLAGALVGRRAFLAVAAGAPLVAALAILADRFGGLVAVASAGVPSVLALAILAVVARLLCRIGLSLRPGHLAAAGASAAIALLALSHPFFHYPDVDTHAAFVRALTRDPGLALDPSSFQERTGAWTREIAGAKVGFPYSPVFHLIAAPLAPLLGYDRAVEALGVLAFGVASLLVAAFAGALGMRPRSAVLAQAGLAVLPVTASRLSLALFPALLGQAFELALVLVLAVGVPPASGRGRAALVAFLVLVQAAYIGSSLTVPAIVAAWALLEWRRRGGRTVAALLAATVASGLLVVAVLYGHFLPTLVRDVLPHAGEETGASGGALAAVGRVWHFFGPAGLALGALGIWTLRTASPGPRNAHRAALLAGAVLLALRYLAPGLFRDVKEVELLTPPVALAAAAALAWLWRRGAAGRSLALVGGATAVWWGVELGWAAYTGRFLAVGLG